MTEKIRIYCDGGARGNPGPAAAAFVAIGPGGKMIKKKGLYLGKATNNVAEYRAIITALSWLADEVGFGAAEIFIDSQLIFNQLAGHFKIKEKKLQALAIEIKSLEKKFSGEINYGAIPRSKNKLADFIVNQTLDAQKRKTKKGV